MKVTLLFTNIFCTQLYGFKYLMLIIFKWIYLANICNPNRYNTSGSEWA